MVAMQCVGLRVALLGCLLWAAAGQAGPFINPVPAQDTDSPVPATFTIVVGHTTAGYNLATVSLTATSSNTSIVGNSDISISGAGSQRVIVARALSKEHGLVSITITATDVESRTGSRVVQLTVHPLEPRFGSGVDGTTIVTRPHTPSFPYNLVFGHGDADKLGRTVLTARVIQDTTNILTDAGVAVTTGGAQFQQQQGLLTVYMKSSSVVFTPGAFPASVAQFHIMDVEFTASDGERSKKATIHVRIEAFPSLTGWCEHKVVKDDTLETIARTYGMHWTTLFLMNNATVLNPKELSPGKVLVLGKPYLVKRHESLFDVASKFGTTWQVLKNLNKPLLVSESQVFEGMVLCVAPGLHFINCRHIW